MADEEKEWLNVSEAARLLQVSRETIYRLMDEEKVLPYTKIKGLQRRRIRRSDLIALIQRFDPGADQAQKKSRK